ncbi:MAG: F0F1 ATP synthase subunit delta [Gemmatimonadaceae bacterium]|nr:F0F1 ATP synthase subunit delta [Gloeobacterales cyanobacterium ES-bin-141]
MSSKVNEQIVQRYAEALKDLGLSQPGLLDKLGEETEVVLKVLDDNPNLEKLLGTPLIDMAAKKKFLVTIFGGRTHPYLLSFMQLLIDRRRGGYLRSICRKYQILLRELQKTTLAEVITAFPLTPEQVEALKQRILSRTRAQRVELRTQLNPDLLGGMIIKLGDEIIDASLRGQLRKLGLQLTAS